MDEWRDAASIPKGAPVIVCVTLYHAGRRVVGEAHWVEQDDAEDGGAWWWANQDAGDYHAEPIAGHITNWMPMPELPEARDVSIPD